MPGALRLLVREVAVNDRRSDGPHHVGDDIGNTQGSAGATWMRTKYRSGLSSEQVEWAVKKQRSHRRINLALLNMAEMSAN